MLLCHSDRGVPTHVTAVGCEHSYKAAPPENTQARILEKMTVDPGGGQRDRDNKKIQETETGRECVRS